MSLVDMRNTIKSLIDSKDVFLPKTFINQLKSIMEDIDNQINVEETIRKDNSNGRNCDKLHFGCGRNLLDGYCNVDIVSPADVLVDARNSNSLRLLEFQSWNEIFSEHFLEHLLYEDACSWLEWCFKALALGGKCVIGVPDTDVTLRIAYQRDADEMNKFVTAWYGKRDMKITNELDFLNMHMRDQLYHHKYHAHYWAWGKGNLLPLLRNIGFSEVKAIDPPDSSSSERRWGTLYVEGTK